MFQNWAGNPQGRGRGYVIIQTFTKFQKGVILKHGKVEERVFWRVAFYWFFCFVFIMIFLCAHVFQKKPLVNNIFLWLIVCLHFHWSIWREGFIFCVSFWLYILTTPSGVFFKTQIRFLNWISRFLRLFTLFK